MLEVFVLDREKHVAAQRTSTMLGSELSRVVCCNNCGSSTTVAEDVKGRNVKGVLVNNA